MTGIVLQIGMSFIGTLLSSFFLNYVIGLIVNYISLFRRKRLWNIILLTVLNGIKFLFYIYNLVMSFIFLESVDLATNVGLYLADIVGVFIAYYVYMCMSIQGMDPIFKTRRRRRFEKAQKMDDKKSVIPKKVIIVFLSICIVFFSLMIVINALDKLNILQVVIYSILDVFVIAILLVVILLREKNVKNVLFVKLPEQTIGFTYTGKASMDYSSFIGRLGKMYFINDYGYVNINDEKIHFAGFSVEEISQDVLDDVKFEKFDCTNYEEAISLFDRLHKKNIFLDENYHILSIEEVRK